MPNMNEPWIKSQEKFKDWELLSDKKVKKAYNLIPKIKG